MRLFHGGPEITLGGPRKAPKVQVASRTISKIALVTETSIYDRGLRCGRDSNGCPRGTIGPPAKMDSQGVMRKIIYRERPMGASGLCYVIDPATGERKLDATTGQAVTFKGHLHLTRSKAPRKTRETRRIELSADQKEALAQEIEMHSESERMRFNAGHLTSKEASE